MRTLQAVFLVLAFWSCGSRDKEISAPPNGWSEERLLQVLDAQERRESDKLCAFLSDTSADVRAVAAFAFASVQDSTSQGCLVKALADEDPHVRRYAAFALSWVADSVSLDRLNNVAENEKDTAVQRVMYESGFRAELALHKHDAIWLISYLESDNRSIRTRAAQTLARLPKEELVGSSNSVMHAVDVERDPGVRMFLIAALKHNATMEVTDKLRTIASSDTLAMIRIAALRALGAKEDPIQAAFILECARDKDPGVRQVAVEQLQRIKEPLDGDAIWRTAESHTDTGTRLSLCSLVMKHGAEQTRAACRSHLQSMKDIGPYGSAATILALGPALSSDTLLTLIRSAEPAVVRQAALTVALDQIRERMARSRFASRKAQYAEIGIVVREVVSTGDAGLISSIAEMLEQEEPDVIVLLLPGELDKEARVPLHPIRDLETILLLDKVVAKRDGTSKGSPFDSAKGNLVPFNHPIDKSKLQALKQGQQYRIVTNMGEIIIATDVNDCPGSSLAFDSLVASGYYDGKYFHRIVPNFVAQGGCPRGDGYGGMPWTLRTEIGLRGFTEGSVGLASAGHDTESCQFFIMTADAPHLDGRYTRFGQVVSGLDVARHLKVGDVMTRVEQVR